jgi:hypothetical protein
VKHIGRNILEKETVLLYIKAAFYIKYNQPSPPLTPGGKITHVISERSPNSSGGQGDFNG